MAVAPTRSMAESAADAFAAAIDNVDGVRERLLKALQEEGLGWTKRELAYFLAVKRWIRDGAPKEVVDMVVPTRDAARAELEWAPHAPKEAKIFKKSFVKQLNANNPDAHAKLWHEFNVKKGRELTREEFLDESYVYLRRKALVGTFGAALIDQILAEFVKERARARKDE